MEKIANLRAFVRARRQAAHQAERAAIDAELARRPLSANERIINGLRMIPLEDALVRAEAEEPDNGPLLDLLRSEWARALKQRTVSREWVAYECIRDLWRSHIERARELAMWD